MFIIRIPVLCEDGTHNLQQTSAQMVELLPIAVRPVNTIYCVFNLTSLEYKEFQYNKYYNIFLK